jgi:hypothetical protein
VGANPFVIAIANVPDRPPLSVFQTGPVRARPGIPLRFDASASKDPDSPIASYAWSFGDGQSQSLTTPQATHAFQNPGTYAVSVKETDLQGCSTTPFTFPFAGGSTLCEGNAGAQVSKQLTVAYPGVSAKCPKSAKPKGCAFKLQAIAAKPKRGKAPKPQSTLAKARVRAGHTAIVSLKPTKAFSAKLAAAKKVMVEETVIIGRSTKTRFVELRIVR